MENIGNISMSHRKEYWPVVSARVSPESVKKLKTKHPNKDEVSKVIRALVERYLEGKILGLRVS